MIEGVTCLEINSMPSDVKPEFDVVFIHGLYSNAVDAWTNENGDVWPLWIKQTLPECRVLFLNYPAPAFFGTKESAVSIKQRARNLADYLPIIGIGKRPTVFVCHSLGGILIKEIIRCCVETGCSIEIAAQTAGIVFIASPHKGAEIATLTSIVGSQLTKDLQLKSAYLLALQAWFSEHAGQAGIAVACYSETQTTHGVLVVSEESASADVDGSVVVPLDGNHSSICKPRSIENNIFLRLKRDIKSTMEAVRKMSKGISAIEDMLSLPFLTNGMYFDLVNILNRELSQGAERAFIISNPCGGGKPCCIIVSEHVQVIQRVMPLQDRWPDRFRVERGLLGEFTEEKEGGEDDMVIGRSMLLNLANTLKAAISSKSRDKDSGRIEQRKIFADAMADYAIDKLSIRIKISLFSVFETEIICVVALHSIENSIRRFVESALGEGGMEREDQTEPEGELRKGLMELRKSMSEEDFSETLAESIACVYKKKHFKFDLILQDDKKVGAEVSHIGQIVRVDQSKDLAILRFGSTSSASSDFRQWCVDNDKYSYKKNLRDDWALSVGDICHSSQQGGTALTVESLSSTVFFPLTDRITSLRSVVVLVGDDAKRGDSGTVLFHRHAGPVAMVVGRTFQGGISKTLAVALGDLPEMEGREASRRAYLLGPPSGDSS